MTDKEKILAAKLLSDAAERYSNDSCNDWEWPADWSIAERRALASQIAELESLDEEEVFNAPSNWIVMNHLAEQLAAEVRKK